MRTLRKMSDDEIYLATEITDYAKVCFLIQALHAKASETSVVGDVSVEDRIINGPKEVISSIIADLGSDADPKMRWYLQKWDKMTDGGLCSLYVPLDTIFYPQKTPECDYETEWTSITLGKPEFSFKFAHKSARDIAEALGKDACEVWWQTLVGQCADDRVVMQIQEELRKVIKRKQCFS